jgi:hypothetical protein
MLVSTDAAGLTQIALKGAFIIMVMGIVKFCIRLYQVRKLIRDIPKKYGIVSAICESPIISPILTSPSAHPSPFIPFWTSPNCYQTHELLPKRHIRSLSSYAPEERVPRYLCLARVSVHRYLALRNSTTRSFPPRDHEPIHTRAITTKA